MKRGFTAWLFVVRQERRMEKAGVFIHFLTLRNCLLALNNTVTRCLARYMYKWKDYAILETKRLQKERMLKAVLKLQVRLQWVVSALYAKSKGALISLHSSHGFAT